MVARDARCRFGQLAETLTQLAIPQDGVSIERQWLPSDVPAFEFGAAHPGPHPLDDQVALEFGDGSDDHDNSSAQRPAGVDPCSRKLMNSMLSRFSSSSTSRKCLTDRAIRSEAQTRTTSKPPRRASRIRVSSPGRFALAPLILSVYSSTILIATLLGPSDAGRRVGSAGSALVEGGGDSHIEGGALHRGIMSVIYISEICQWGVG